MPIKPVKAIQKSITLVPFQSDTSVVGLCVFHYLIYVEIHGLLTDYVKFGWGSIFVSV